MNKMNPQVDEYIQKAQRWQVELEKLRAIVLDCGLTEAFKWRTPCYTVQNGNVVMISEEKKSCTLSFLKGSLLKDVNGILVKPGENSRAARIIRFTSMGAIAEMEPTLKVYINEAINVEKAGLKVEFDKHQELAIPAELQTKFAKSPAFQTAFEALTPGRQRGYVIYFSAPKQAKSQQSRIEKYRQRILDGKGINDCVCGLSRKQPNCDGSHKYIQRENKG